MSSVRQVCSSMSSHSICMDVQTNPIGLAVQRAWKYDTQMNQIGPAVQRAWQYDNQTNAEQISRAAFFP